jgi:hypothetical protein
MNDFVYVLEVEFPTLLSMESKRMVFSSRDEAETFRIKGKRKGYFVKHLLAYPIYTADKANRLIADEKHRFHNLSQVGAL